MTIANETCNKLSSPDIWLWDWIKHFQSRRKKSTALWFIRNLCYIYQSMIFFRLNTDIRKSHTCQEPCIFQPIQKHAFNIGDLVLSPFPILTSKKHPMNMINMSWKDDEARSMILNLFSPLVSQIIYDNDQRSGQVLVNLVSQPMEVDCDSQTLSHEAAGKDCICQCIDCVWT